MLQIVLTGPTTTQEFDHLRVTASDDGIQGGALRKPGALGSRRPTSAPAAVSFRTTSTWPRITAGIKALRPVLCRMIQRCAALDQPFDQRGVACGGGQHQRCLAVSIACFDVGAAAHKCLSSTMQPRSTAASQSRLTPSVRAPRAAGWRGGRCTGSWRTVSESGQFDV